MFVRRGRAGGTSLLRFLFPAARVSSMSPETVLTAEKVLEVLNKLQIPELYRGVTPLEIDVAEMSLSFTAPLSGYTESLTLFFTPSGRPSQAMLRHLLPSEALGQIVRPYFRSPSQQCGFLSFVYDNIFRELDTPSSRAVERAVKVWDVLWRGGVRHVLYLNPVFIFAPPIVPMKMYMDTDLHDMLKMLGAKQVLVALDAERPREAEKIARQLLTEAQNLLGNTDLETPAAILAAAEPSRGSVIVHWFAALQLVEPRLGLLLTLVKTRGDRPDHTDVHVTVSPRYLLAPLPCGARSERWSTPQATVEVVKSTVPDREEEDKIRNVLSMLRRTPLLRW